MANPWQPLVRADLIRNPGTGDGKWHRATDTDPEIWRNRLYQVSVTRLPAGDMVLSIKEKDGTPRHDWREFQLIKNDIAGPEREAVELYPAESRLVDTANQFFLYVFPAGMQAPFGFHEREVSEARIFDSSTQRSWPSSTRPKDLLSAEELQAREAHRNSFRVPSWPVCDCDVCGQPRQSTPCEHCGAGEEATITAPGVP